MSVLLVTSIMTSITGITPLCFSWPLMAHHLGASKYTKLCAETTFALNYWSKQLEVFFPVM